MILHAPTRPLGGDTIVLRLPVDHDADALVRYGHDPDLAETVWAPIPSPCTRAEAAERLDYFKRGWEEENRFGPALIIADAETDEMIGALLLRLLSLVRLAFDFATEHDPRGGKESR